MTTHILLLRGINVSGHNLIKMEALTKMLINLGFRNVQTYIQSGNVILQSDETPSKIAFTVKQELFKECTCYSSQQKGFGRLPIQQPIFKRKRSRYQKTLRSFCIYGTQRKQHSRFKNKQYQTRRSAP